MADEYIRKEDAIDVAREDGKKIPTVAIRIMHDIKAIPVADVVPAEPQEIGYDQCANAMLKMWIDNVVTDGEYNRIMDKLNKHYGKV